MIIAIVSSFLNVLDVKKFVFYIFFENFHYCKLTQNNFINIKICNRVKKTKNSKETYLDLS